MFANIRKINEFHTFNMLIADIIFLSLQTCFCIMNTKVKGYILALITGELNMPSSEQWYLWGNVLALAIFPTIISLICTTEAIQCIGSTPTAILGVLEPVTAVFFGVVVFGEVLTPRIILGLILVITSVTFVVAGGNLGKILLRIKKMFPKKKAKDER